MIVRYNFHCYLIIPRLSTIELIFPCNCKYDNFDVGVKITEQRVVFTTSINKEIKRYAGSGVKFHRLSCSPKDDKSLVYMGVCCQCPIKDYCREAKSIVDKIHANSYVLGVSVGSLYNKKYVGVYAKTPHSQEDFERLLSFAAELKEMLECEENS